MKINLITALSLFEVEDLVVESLSAREFQLFARAHSKSNLKDLLESYRSEHRVLVVMAKEISINHDELQGIDHEQIAILEIDEEQSFTSEWLFEKAYEQLRKTESDPTDRKAFLQTKLVATNDWIGFTGCTASPGTTTLATNLAAEFSLFQKTNLIDADTFRPDIEMRLGLKNSANLIELSDNLNFLQLSNYLSNENTEQEDWNLQLDKDAFTCVDLGRAPDFRRAISDRRKHGRSYIENLKRCKKLVYVINPEPHCFGEMIGFYRQMNEIYPEAQVIFVMNGVISSSRHQGLKKSFAKKVMDLGAASKPHFIPLDVALIDRAKAKFATVNEIAPRSPVRKAYQELAIYLKNSF